MKAKKKININNESFFTKNNLEYTGHKIVLNDAKTTVDGGTVSSSPKYNTYLFYKIYN